VPVRGAIEIRYSLIERFRIEQMLRHRLRSHGRDHRGFVSLGVHASYGPSAQVLAYGDIVGGKRLEGGANYQAGKPLAEKLVTRVSDLHLK